MPEHLIKLGSKSAANRLWVSSLPATIEKLASEWKLELGEPVLKNVTCSFVAPCRVVGQQFDCIFKIGLPHEEALHEIAGLRLLNGQPTARLLKYDIPANAMLLERCIPGTHLNTFPETEQDEIICTILKDIWSANIKDQVFRPLSDMVASWNRETLSQLDHFPSAELAIRGCKLKEVLVESTAEQVLLATDLHAGNVLKAQRAAWLVIDIKPYIGDRTYDLTQHLFNCMDRFSADPNGVIIRVAKLANVNEERLKLWMQARLLAENNGIYQHLGERLVGH